MAAPLAERLRPQTLDDYIGQKHLVGPDAVLRKMIDSGRISSFILWGPPGVGKTTLAQIIAHRLETPFYTLSAVTSGVKDVREVIEKARNNRFFTQASPILFIDEIHRFSKSQQDSLLGAVEQGTGHADRSHDGKSVFRGHTSAFVPLPVVCLEKPDERRPAGIAAQGCGKRYHTENETYRIS